MFYGFFEREISNTLSHSYLVEAKVDLILRLFVTFIDADAKSPLHALAASIGIF